MTPTADTLYTGFTARLPGWLFRGLERVRREGPLLYGDDSFAAGLYAGDPAILFENLPKDAVFGPLTTMMGEHYAWFAALLQQTFLTYAHAEWLDLHAADRGASRRTLEPDDQLRPRLRQIADKATETAILAACEAVVGAGQAEVFTLRNRMIAWADKIGPMGRARRDRSFYNFIPRWGRPVTPIPRPHRHDVDMLWSRSHWELAAWSDPRFGLRRAPAPLNPFLVSIVLVKPQEIVLSTAWRRAMAWGRSPWGGTTPDLGKYKRLRQAVEETRAAGIHVEIWITPED